MEIKKSEKADLERSRTTRLLLGLIVALTLLYCALEYQSGGGGDAWDMGDVDEMVEDFEFTPRNDNRDMIAYTKGVSEPKEADKIKKADKPEPSEQPVELERQEADNAAHNDQRAEPSQDEQNPSALIPAGTDESALSLRVVEQLPEFPGGMVAFMKWITKNLRYPAAAQRQKIEGQVTVAFVIGKDGTVSDIKVTKSVNPYLDTEALRVVRKMPKWKPGEADGKPCATYFSIPIVFKL